MIRSARGSLCFGTEFVQRHPAIHLVHILPRLRRQLAAHVGNRLPPGMQHLAGNLGVIRDQKTQHPALWCPKSCPEIWVSQGRKQGTLCHWVWDILPPMDATACFGGCAILPPSGNNSLPFQRRNTLLIRGWDTLPQPALPLDSLFFPLACPLWAGRIDPDPVRTGSGMFH